MKSPTLLANGRVVVVGIVGAAGTTSDGRTSYSVNTAERYYFSAELAAEVVANGFAVYEAPTNSDIALNPKD